MHVGMLLGTTLGIPHWRDPGRRLRRTDIMRAIVCYSAMLIGMEAGMLFTSDIPGMYQTTATMVLGMLSGMTVGLILQRSHPRLPRPE